MFDKYAISVCRIEPENNIHVILEAFAEGPMPLMVVGNWEYSVYGRDLRARYGKNPNLAMLGPIYDHEKLNELAASTRAILKKIAPGLPQSLVTTSP